MTADRQERRMRSIAGIWLGVATTFAGMTWDARWHAAGGTHEGVVPPHLLILAGVAIVFVAAARGRRGAEGRLRTYLGAVALASGIALAGEAADQIMHLLYVEGAAVALAHLASTFGFLSALFVAVMATATTVRGAVAESAS